MGPIFLRFSAAVCITLTKHILCGGSSDLGDTEAQADVLQGCPRAPLFPSGIPGVGVGLGGLVSESFPGQRGSQVGGVGTRLLQ